MMHRMGRPRWYAVPFPSMTSRAARDEPLRRWQTPCTGVVSSLSSGSPAEGPQRLTAGDNSDKASTKLQDVIQNND